MSLVVIWLLAFPVAALVEEQITITAANVESRRQELIAYIWGSAGFPAGRLPDSIVRNVPSPVGPLPNLSRVDLFRINDASEKSRAFHFVPASGNGQVVIVHNGHNGYFQADPSDESLDDQGPGMKRLIRALLEDGFGVLAVMMPGAIGQIDLGDGTVEPAFNRTHAEIFARYPDGAAFRFFLEPSIISLNAVQNEYVHYHMTGLSGGGWTTVHVAAVDTRIRVSVPIAGSVPLYLRRNYIGDAEQDYAPFYSRFGYLDLYMLGSYGSATYGGGRWMTGRKQVQVLNRRDNCCFGQAQRGDAWHRWNADVREYERAVRDRLTLMDRTKTLGFRVEIDESAPAHMVSWNTLIGTVLAEVNDGRRSFAGVRAQTVIARDFRRRMQLYMGGAWREAPYETIGVPGVVDHGTHLEIVYREPAVIGIHADRLMVTTYANGVWTSAAPLPLPFGSPSDWAVASDPVVTKSGSGRWDMVAAGRDGKLYHWRSVNGVVGVAVIPETRYVRGVPSIVSLPDGKVDVFYRSEERALYGAHWNGEKWTVTVIGGGLRDFPSAAVTTTDPSCQSGCVHVFVRTMANQLWQATRVSSEGAWSWSRVSTSAIEGSSAAAVENGQLQVYARNRSGNLVTFLQSGTGWDVASRGGAVIGSPTAITGAAFVRSVDSGAWTWLVAGGWQARGGWID